MPTLPRAKPKAAVAPARKTTTIPHPAHQADENWLLGLLDGSGSSASQIIVSAVLGCVPGVGQLFDLRDIIKGVIAVSVNSANVGAWVELVITLIGCIPAFGDAFKAAFKLAKSGKGADRVFDAMRKYAKVDPKKALASINWTSLRKQVIDLLNSVLNEMIDALDSWVVKKALGEVQVKNAIAMMRKVKNDAPPMVDKALKEIKSEIDTLIAVPKKVNSTAAASASKQLPSAPVKPKISPKPPSKTATTSGSKKPPTEPPKKPPVVKNDKTTERAPEKQATQQTGKKEVDQIRQSKKKRWSTGVPAEHIVDYYAKTHRPRLRKINDHGRLIEEYDRLKRNAEGDRIRAQDINQTGIDHLWFGSYKGRKYLVGETKGSIFGQFAFLAGMAAGDAKAIEESRSEIGAIFDAKKDYDPASALPERKTSAETSMKDEGSLMGKPKQAGLSGTKSKGRQMSHVWIQQSLKQDLSIPSGHKITIINHISKAFKTETDPDMYTREIYMVTGKQYEQHDRSKGKAHNIQFPIIKIPDNVLPE